MARISAIIVARNNRKDIGRCLASLRASADSLHEIIVVDNGSNDGTPDLIRRDFPEVTLLDYWDNPGFGEGNNRGARVASGDYLLLINPDAMVSADCAGILARALDADATVGITVPKVVLASEPAIINSAGLCVNRIGYGWDRGYLEWDRGQYDREEDVLAGSACALMVRADTFRQLGGFDAPYFMYYEDLDLCWRFWLCGSSVRYVPHAVVRHAMKVSFRPDTYNEYIDHRNRLRTLLKNLSFVSLLRLSPQLLLFEAGSVLRQAQYRRWKSIRLRVRAWLWNLAHLGGTLSRRRFVQRRRTRADAALSRLFVAGRTPVLRASLPNYREQYDDSVDDSEVPSVITMGVNEAGALGLGWYDAAPFDGIISRWSCGYGIAFLSSAGALTQAQLVIRCASLCETEVVIRTDGEEKAHFSLSPGEWRDLKTTIPLTGRFVRVELVVSPTFVPAQSGRLSGDQRTLGIAVARLALAEPS